MTATAEELLQAALALSEDDRAGIAATLLESLEPPMVDDAATVQALWNEELDRRARQALASGSSWEEWATVRQRLADDVHR